MKEQRCLTPTVSFPFLRRAEPEGRHGGGEGGRRQMGAAR